MSAPRAFARILVVARLASASLILTACSNPFAPDTARPPGREELPPPQKATTPAIAMDNLARAFNERDKEIYETVLDPDFYFREMDCRGELVSHNWREEELDIMGSRDGSSHGIFDLYRTIEWDFQLIQLSTELGRDYPMSYEDDPDGHPTEDWEVFRGRVDILLLESRDNGQHVPQQVMNFKLRKGDDGLWRIIRWYDDPLSGECGDLGEETEKPVASDLRPASWSQLKTR